LPAIGSIFRRAVVIFRSHSSRPPVGPCPRISRSSANSGPLKAVSMDPAHGAEKRRWRSPTAARRTGTNPFSRENHRAEQGPRRSPHRCRPTPSGVDCRNRRPKGTGGPLVNPLQTSREEAEKARNTNRSRWATTTSVASNVTAEETHPRGPIAAAGPEAGSRRDRPGTSRRTVAAKPWLFNAAGCSRFSATRRLTAAGTSKGCFIPSLSMGRGDSGLTPEQIKRDRRGTTSWQSLQHDRCRGGGPPVVAVGAHGAWADTHPRRAQARSRCSTR